MNPLHRGRGHKQEIYSFGVNAIHSKVKKKTEGGIRGREMKYRGVGKRPGDNHHKIEITRPHV
jgi:hypothetical protein